MWVLIFFVSVIFLLLSSVPNRLRGKWKVSIRSNTSSPRAVFKVIYQHEEKCFTPFANTEKLAQKTRPSRVFLFLSTFEVFGNGMKHSFACLIELLKPRKVWKCETSNAFLSVLLIFFIFVTVSKNMRIKTPLLGFSMDWYETEKGTNPK